MSAPHRRSSSSLCWRVGVSSRTVVSPSAARPASNTAPLTWALGDRRAVVDPVQSAAGDRQRREPAPLAAVDEGPHLPQRLDDAVHGPPPDRRVTVEDGETGHGSGPTGQQPDGRPGVAHVDRDLGLMEPVARPPSTTMASPS